MSTARRERANYDMFEGTYEVAIIGYGPTGQALAAMMGLLGHRVAVVERHKERYVLARSGMLEHEIMRIYQSLGCADRILATTAVPIVSRQVFNREGTELMVSQDEANTISGWRTGYMMWQPLVEDAVVDLNDELPCVDVRTGWDATAIRQHADVVEVDVEQTVRDSTGRRTRIDETATVRAQYVIGADGANSLVRSAAGIALEDFGFKRDWLVVDTEPLGELPAVAAYVGGHALAYGPYIYQIFDPDRPRKLMPLGKRHRRFEWAVLDDEETADVERPEFAYKLLAEFGGTPDNMRIVRQAVYSYEGRLAHQFSRQRSFLIGDAAHTMPPYLGSGMATGLRDARNLSWKLSFVLRHLADPSLLLTYEAERRPHARAYIEESIAHARLSNTFDAELADERDAAFARGEQPLAVSLPGLEHGLLHSEPSGDRGLLSGTLSPQGMVVAGGQVGRFDDLYGSARFLVLGDRFDPREDLNAEQLGFLDRIGAVVVSIVQPKDIGTSGAAVAVDDFYAKYFQAHGVCAFIARPDLYVFGAATSRNELGAIVDDLRTQLLT